MGNDAALAVLSDQPRMIYDYFKQLFAQVTNPPIDSIREEVIMSLECYVGPEKNLLSTTENMPIVCCCRNRSLQRRIGRPQTHESPRLESESN